MTAIVLVISLVGGSYVELPPKDPPPVEHHYCADFHHQGCR